MYEYKCPFCTIHDLKAIEDLEPKQIINLCDKSNENSNIDKFMIDELRAFDELMLSKKYRVRNK